MIKYKLICKDCNISFDSWFASSQEFEKLKKKKYLNCHSCNSKKVEKSLMAPRLINKLKKNELENNNLNEKEINKKIKEYQKFIKKNFEYVGKNLLTKQDLYITTRKKNIKEFLDQLLTKK